MLFFDVSNVAEMGGRGRGFSAEGRKLIKLKDFSCRRREKKMDFKGLFQPGQKGGGSATFDFGRSPK